MVLFCVLLIDLRYVFFYIFCIYIVYKCYSVERGLGCYSDGIVLDLGGWCLGLWLIIIWKNVENK